MSKDKAKKIVKGLEMAAFYILVVCAALSNILLHYYLWEGRII